MRCAQWLRQVRPASATVLDLLRPGCSAHAVSLYRVTTTTPREEPVTSVTSYTAQRAYRLLPRCVPVGDPTHRFRGPYTCIGVRLTHVWSVTVTPPQLSSASPKESQLHRSTTARLSCRSCGKCVTVLTAPCAHVSAPPTTPFSFSKRKPTPSKHYSSSVM